MVRDVGMSLAGDWESKVKMRHKKYDCLLHQVDTNSEEGEVTSTPGASQSY